VIVDTNFRSMGCDVRLIADSAAIDRARHWLAGFDARLSRFRPDSELCALNADLRAEVPASALLRAAVRAGIWAAERSGGLVDPTLLGALEQAGYRESLELRKPADLHVALRAPRLPCRSAPSAGAGWRLIEVDDDAGVIRRPPGLRIDSGGFGKGLAADALARRLAHHGHAVIDCGGDIRVLGASAVAVEHPLTGEIADVISVVDGAVATSGIGRRIWRNLDGSFAHHLIDPATGGPAWTGVIQATALAPSALEAETLAKMALLSGAQEGRLLLAETGGALVLEDGSFELIPPAVEAAA
jgi:thiamine biosynthesis lipoprotein